RFDTAQARLLESLKTNVNSDIADFKRRRYSGITGPGQWLIDLFLDLNELPEVKAIFDRNLETYKTRVDGLIADITADTNRTIDECKQILSNARTEMQARIAAMGPAERQRAQSAIDRANQAFAAMETRIEQAATSVRNALAEARSEEHTSELQSRENLVCRLLLEKNKH